MNNMTNKEKFLYIFLQIITLGTIWIYWNHKNKKYNKQNVLSQDYKINIDLNELIDNLGGSDNINNIENTHNKIKFFYNQYDLIDIDAIKKDKSISGVFINDKFIVLIVGNSAAAITNKIKETYNISSK